MFVNAEVSQLEEAAKFFASVGLTQPQEPHHFRRIAMLCIPMPLEMQLPDTAEMTETLLFPIHGITRDNLNATGFINTIRL